MLITEVWKRLQAERCPVTPRHPPPPKVLLRIRDGIMKECECEPQGRHVAWWIGVLRLSLLGNNALTREYYLYARFSITNEIKALWSHSRRFVVFLSSLMDRRPLAKFANRLKRSCEKKYMYIINTQNIWVLYNEWNKSFFVTFSVHCFVIIIMLICVYKHISSFL